MQAEEERINRQKQLEQEERIAKELARISYEKQREEKMRQHIKENRYVCSTTLTKRSSSSAFLRFDFRCIITLLFSIELRELESKLKSAYLNKERAAQIAEHEALVFETMVSAGRHDSKHRQNSFPTL